STDGVDELIKEYEKKAPFPVRYYYKENGGKHTAHNMALKLARGEYFLSVDSDDALTDDAVQKSLDIWDNIPEDKKDEYWCVAGLCVDARNPENTIGNKYPEDINDAPDPRALAALVKGDKTGCASTAKMREFPFPEPKDTTFITEIVVYNKLDNKYKQFYCNEILKYVYTNEPDSLCASWFKNHVEQGYVSNFYWKVNTLNDMGLASGKKLLFEIPYYGFMAKRSAKEILSEINDPKYRAAVALIMPIAGAYKLLKRIKG
ncbi:MAG: glycosyltransferase family 2 protein, partial [Firmicutes bacterium]|nr:glycosyltransferase family 2 protein [Bacillota bacterium]